MDHWTKYLYLYSLLFLISMFLVIYLTPSQLSDIRIYPRINLLTRKWTKITLPHKDEGIVVREVCLNPEGHKGIYVFASESNKTVSLHGFEVKMFTHKFFNHTYKNKTFAYFLTVYYGALGNLYHFFRDLALPMFYLVKKMDTLNDASNSLFLARKMMPGWTSPLLHAMNIKPLIQVARVSHFECFEKAVFASPGNSYYKPMDYKYMHDLVQYLKKGFNITYDKCNTTLSNILILGRKQRQILNLKELVMALQSNSSQNIEMVFMEKLSLRRQMQKAQCTDIFIGVHGAGLMWASFMKAGSHLIEIAWPEAGGLNFLYTTNSTKMRFYQNINVHKLSATNVSASFAVRTKLFFRNKHAPQRNKASIKKYKNEILETLPGKHADVTVDIPNVLQLVNTILLN